MNNRGIVSKARRAGVSLLLAALFVTLVTLCLGGRDATLAQTAGVSANSVANKSASMRGVGGLSFVNLTNAPNSDQKYAVWSPTADRIAYLSNGVDSNNDGQLDAIGPNGAGRFAIYTITPEGSGLKLVYPLDIAENYTVNSIAWAPSGTAIYAVLQDLATASYSIASISVATGAKTILYGPVTNSIFTLAVPASASELYFDMVTGFTNTAQIYALTLTGNAAPRVLTNVGDNRQPTVVVSAAYPAGIIAYSHINPGSHTRIDAIPSGGGDPFQLSTPQNGDDTFPRGTADGRIVFLSTRADAGGGNGKKIWIMGAGGELNSGPATPCFTSTGTFLDMLNPAPNPVLAKADQILFDRLDNGHLQIFLGSTDDSAAPYITDQLKSYRGQAVVGNENKSFNAGEMITVTVPVRDDASGISHVWLQVKDPDPAELDVKGVNHVITTLSSDTDTTGGQTPSSHPEEFLPFNPQTNNFLDITQDTSNPGYYARAGTPRLFDEGQGYPEVPSHWVEMRDNGPVGISGDVTANDGIYSCHFSSPFNLSNDWILDVIVEDNSHLQQDSLLTWHGNRRRFDNVGGFTTQPFTGGRNILFVDDYLDGQRFLSLGLPPAAMTYDPALYLNSMYYFTGGTGDPATISPFTSAGEFGGADVWRVICRGAVPDSVIAQYKPTIQTQVSLSDKRTPLAVKNGDKMIVWASPNPLYHMYPVQDFPSLQPYTGSILETSVQNKLTQFVTDGGRLFVIGKDLAQSLTAEGTKTNSFLTSTLGARLVSQTLDMKNLKGNASISLNYRPFALHKTDFPSASWYGDSLAVQRWPNNGNVKLPRNSNPSQFVTTDLVSPICTWDIITPVGGALAAIAASNDNTATDVVGVTRELASNGGRTVFWSFGYEDISSYVRAQAAGDTLDWLMDGAIKGTVVQENSLKPVEDALVVISQVTPGATSATDIVRVVAAARTDASGTYRVYGLRPGAHYRAKVTATGYFGTLEKSDIPVVGSKVTSSVDTSFFIYRDINTSTIWGYVNRGTAPVANAMVTAVPVGGGSTPKPVITNALGRYELTNLDSGQYAVTAVDSLGGPAATATPDPVVSAGEVKRVDLQFSSNVVVANQLSGTVVGSDGIRIVGAGVALTLNGAFFSSTTSDLNGSFTFAGLAAGDYTVTTTASGFAGASQVVSYLPATGANINITMANVNGGAGAGQVFLKVYDGSTASALGGVTVEILASGSVISSKTTASTFSGSGTLSNIDFTLPPGSYQIRLSYTGRKTIIQSLAIAPGQIITGQVYRMDPLLTLHPGTMLYSFPGTYTQDFPELLGTDVATLNNKIAGNYDNIGSTYQMYTGPGTLLLQPGKAYWMKLNAPLTVQTEGTPVDTTTPFSLPLQAGWNLVGDPFPFAVDLFDCTVTSPAGTVTFQNAQNSVPALLGGAVYGWNGSSYQIVTIMQPYAGYWVFASNQCVLNISNRSAVRTITPVTRRAVAQSGEWRVQLNLNANGMKDSCHYFGVSSGARDGFDNTTDFRLPPAPDSAPAVLAFPHQDWGINNGQYATDIRSAGAGEKKWVFTITANTTGSDITLDWPELQVQLPGGMQAILRDTVTGQQQYMNTVAGYSFRATQVGEVRSFEVTVGARTAGISISNVQASSVRNDVVVKYNLSAPADVTVTLSQGIFRKVLLNGIPANAGANTVIWDRKDDNGRLMPRGIYNCEVKVADNMGRLIRSTTPFMLK